MRPGRERRLRARDAESDKRGEGKRMCGGVSVSGGCRVAGRQ